VHQSTLYRVRNGDNESYLCGSLLPSSARGSFFATRAFNLEVAGVRDLVRGNVAMGRMRMAFWRDFVGAVCHPEFLGSVGQAPQPQQQFSAHPLYSPLRESVARHKHTRRWLECLVDARDADLDGRPPADLASLEAYAEATHGSLLYLTLEALGVRDASADHAASHVGKAAGIAMLLRSLPVHMRLGQLYLPMDLMAKVRAPLSTRARVLQAPFFYGNTFQSHFSSSPPKKKKHPHTRPPPQAAWTQQRGPAKSPRGGFHRQRGALFSRGGSTPHPASAAAAATAPAAAVVGLHQ
jgi:hypothetical protein